MTKYRCPRFGCNGIGLPAETRRAFGYRGHKVLTFECQKCGRTWQQRI